MGKQKAKEDKTDEDKTDEVIKAELPITSVIVYRRGAGIKRSAKVALTKTGLTKIRLPNLPLIMDDNSVRVSIKRSGSGPDPLVRGVNVILELPDDIGSFSYKEEERLKDCYYEQSVLETEAASMLDLINRYKGINLQKVEIEEKHISSPINGRIKLSDIVLSQIKNLASERLKHLKKLRSVKREIAEIEGNRQRLSNAKERREKEIKKSVIIDLDSNSDAESVDVHITLEYLIPGARWTSVYSLDFINNFTRTIVNHRGMVVQKSGEDWSAAALTLSTAEAWSWTEIPELKAKIIGRQRPPASAKGWREPPEGWQTLYADFDNFNARSSDAKSKITGSFGGGAAPDRDSVDGYEDEFEEDYHEEIEDVSEAVQTAEIMPMEPVGRIQKKKQRASPKARKAMPAMSSKLAAPMGMKEDIAASSASEPEVLYGGVDYSDPGNLLDWGIYRLPDYSSNKRNSLQVLSLAEKYMEMIVQNGVQLSYNVLDLISSSMGQANSVFNLPLPEHCTNPCSINGYDYTFNSLGLVDIPSDNQLHMVPLKTFEVDSSIKFISVPREDSMFFRSVSFCNATDAPLLAGPTEISIGGQYLLSSNLPESPKSAVIELGLGAEERIKIARNVIFEERTSGILNTNLSLYHKITINITNNLTYTVPLEIQERIPVPHKDNDKTKVELIKCEPAWKKFPDKYRQLEGGYRWTFNLKAGESKELLVEYSIEIPANSEVIDGNRREN